MKIKPRSRNFALLVLSLSSAANLLFISTDQALAEKSDTENEINSYATKIITLIPEESSQQSDDSIDPRFCSSCSASAEYDQRLIRLERKSNPQKYASAESDSGQELELQVRPRPLDQLPPSQLPAKAAVPFKPIGYLNANIGYFQTSNIFSTSSLPIEDSLAFAGLTLTSANFSLGPKTFTNASIDGNLIRYINQSKYDYNQLRFNLGLYQQLSPQMYGGITWSNQQLFYANSSSNFHSGDRFLNEHSLQLSFSKRESLTKKLILDGIYGVSINFSDPESQSRLINSFWISLSYYLQKPLQVGLDYQYNLSDFTQQDREDQLHRLFGHINYRLSDTSNINAQGGVSLGGSTTPNIDYSGWFFTLNYNFEIGRF